MARNARRGKHYQNQEGATRGFSTNPNSHKILQIEAQIKPESSA
ncbi:hypothetical protein HanOQP8_Chr17g0662241 [Helianthus annuus]|nr:hypothetical protein HanOQP8_Chr17g0662241 [Helianthus annuus]